MPRVKRGVTAKARHKKVLKAAKGYYGARSRSFRVANQAVTKAGQYAYRDRKVRKREFRALWIQRIGAAAQDQRIVIQPLRSRIEGSWRGTGSQGVGRYCRTRFSGFWSARRASQGQPLTRIVCPACRTMTM